MNAPTPSPTGDQYVISRGSARAVITQVAAALREFTVGGEHITEGYPESVTPPFGSGIVLAPWPNRVEDGKWVLDGVQQQLDITEPKLNNALHGLLRFTPYRVIEHSDSVVELAATIFPQHGFPFRLETSVRYELIEGGLSVTHEVRNDSAAPAPVAFGTHPFLRVGDVPVEELTLTAHASTRFEVDDRLNPTAETSVASTEFDLRAGRLVSELQLDTAFGGLITQNGVSASLRAPDGREVRLVQDEDHPYLQIFTTRIFPKNGGTGLAVAIEPMTAPPNALNSGLGLRWVDPGDSWSVGWGIQYAGFNEGE